MPIRISCPSCGKTLSVPDGKAGTRGTCPACKHRIDVPAAAPTPPPPPGPPYALDTWDQVDGVLGGAVEVADRRLTDREEAAVRAGLTGYANAVPHHGVADLGGRVRITKVRDHRAYRSALDTVLESRSAARGFRPFGGPDPPAPTTDEKTINVWGYSYPPYTEFAPATREHPVDDSRSVMTCTTCGGQTTLACDGCSGRGAVACPTCGGHGQTACGNCDGDGTVRRLARVDQRQAHCRACTGGRMGFGPDSYGHKFVCTRCNGTAIVFEEVPVYETVDCPGCRRTGAVTCRTCQGHKQVRCSPCSGSGRQTCGGCEGHGRLVSFLAVVRRFEADAQAGTLPAPGVTDATAAGMVRPADFSPFLTLVATSAPPSLALARGPEPVRAWIGRAFAAARSKEAADKRLARQRLRVEAASVLEVGYEYEGKGYTAWFVGESLAAFAPDSPVADALKGMVRDAVRAWEDGDPKGAALGLREVLDMAAADPCCRAAYESVRGTIPPGLESKARWVRWKPYITAVAAVYAALFLVGLAGLGYAFLRAKPGPVPPGVSGPRAGEPGAAAKEGVVALEFRTRSVSAAKGGTATLRLSVRRPPGAEDRDVVVRLEAGGGLTVPARVSVGRGREEAEVEVRAGGEAGVFMVKARAEGSPPSAPTAECRVSVGEGPDALARRLVGEWVAQPGGVRLALRENGTAVLTPAGGGPPLLARYRVTGTPGDAGLTLDPSDARMVNDSPEYRVEVLGDDEVLLAATPSRGRGAFAGLAGRLRRARAATPGDAAADTPPAGPPPAAGWAVLTDTQEQVRRHWKQGDPRGTSLYDPGTKTIEVRSISHLGTFSRDGPWREFEFEVEPSVLPKDRFDLRVNGTTLVLGSAVAAGRGPKAVAVRYDPAGRSVTASVDGELAGRATVTGDRWGDRLQCEVHGGAAQGTRVVLRLRNARVR